MNLFDSDNSKQKLGYAKVGGIGDTIQQLILANALKRKYPDSQLTLYIRDKNRVWDNFKNADKIVFTGNGNWTKIRLTEAKRFDLFFDDIYIVGKYKEGKLITKGNTKEKYLNGFKNPNLITDNVLEESAKNLGVELKEEDFDLNELITNNKLEKIVKKPYIIIHNGRHKLRATKSYPTSYYEEAIKPLKKIYNIFQVGTIKEPYIKETIDLRGKLTLEELFSFVRGAKLVITQEGALGHIARVFNTKAIVLFGATPINCFGYKENINIEGKLRCSGCWYSSKDWYKYCPKKLPKKVDQCDSLRNIQPSEITNQALSIL